MGFHTSHHFLKTRTWGYLLFSKGNSLQTRGLGCAKVTFLGPVTLPSDLRSYPPMALIPTSSLPIPFLMFLTTSTSPSPHLPSGCTPLTPYPPVLATHPPGWTPRMASSSLGSASGKEDLDESSWSPWLPLWRGGTGGSGRGLWVEEWGSFSSCYLATSPWPSLPTWKMRWQPTGGRANGV